MTIINNAVYIPISREFYHNYFGEEYDAIICSNSPIYEILNAEYVQYKRQTEEEKNEDAYLPKKFKVCKGKYKPNSGETLLIDTNTKTVVGLVTADDSVRCTKAYAYALYPIISATMQNILGDIVKGIQNHLTTNKSNANQSATGIINITLYIQDYPTYGKLYQKFHNDLLMLRDNIDFVFYWTPEMINSPETKAMFKDKNGNPLFGPNSIVSTNFKLFNEVTSADNQYGVETVTISPMAIPFMTYYGKGVGGVDYSNKILQSLKGKYSKRLYPVLMDMTTQANIEHKISLKQFREIVNVDSTKYSNSKIMTKILIPSLIEINEGTEKPSAGS